MSWTYDALGRKTGQTNRSSGSVAWAYDGAARMTSRTADSVTVDYTYDALGNRTEADDGSISVASTYDRLNRPLNVTTTEGLSSSTTTYNYDDIDDPAWTDPSGSYTASLDKFDRQVDLTDPLSNTYAWTYRADGRVDDMTGGNGLVTEHEYDALGRLTSKDTGSGGAVANYGWTWNHGGVISSESSTISGDPGNGTTTYTYDAPGRLATSTRSSTTTFGWDKVPNRTSVQVGGGSPVTTTYDAANRATSGGYASDDDGRMVANAAGDSLVWDGLNRLTEVRDSLAQPIAAYTYDPLDRLHEANGVRFHYVGLTSHIAKIDPSGTSSDRFVGHDWNGTRLVDWNTSNVERFYGTNAHHDVTHLTSSAGVVVSTVRYDAWGNVTNSSGTLPPFRFQGNWVDENTGYSWIVTRWYDPGQGRFISEDSLLGKPQDPSSRHLLAYAQGEPVGRWDPDGRACLPTWTAHYKLYGCANATGTSRTFNSRSIGGKVRIALFIPEDRVCAPAFPPVCIAGDHRGWSNPTGFDCLRARACITVNMAMGSLYASAMPSCGINRDCYTARPWSANTYGTFVRRVNAVAVNADYMSTMQTYGCTRRVRVVWSLNQSYYEMNTPSIDGSFWIRRCGDYVDFYVTGDGFPNFEMSYRTPRATVGAHLRVFHAGSGGADGLQYLATGLGDWNKRWRTYAPR